MTTRAQQFECLATGILSLGSPISTPYVRFYAAGTTDLKSAYADKDKQASFTKLALDGSGRGVAYGDGLYKLKFYSGDPDDGGSDSGIEIDNLKVTAVIGNIHTVTSDTTIDRDTYLVMADTSGDDIELTLGSIDTFDNPIIIKKTSASNTLTITPDGSNTIDGSASATLTENNESLTLIPDTAAKVWRKHLDKASGIVGYSYSGSDTNLITGTAGTDGNLSQWNADGDLVDGPTPPSGDIIGTTDTQTLTNKTIDADNNTVSNLAHGAEVDEPSSGVHGVSGSVVGTTDTQTLTNKTLTAPILNGGSGLGATDDEIDAAADGIGVSIPRQKIVTIGDWNMDSTAQVDVAHGLTLSKIIGARVCIRDDSDSYHFIAGQVYDAPTGNTDLWISQIDSTNVSIVRLGSGNYDGTGYDSTSFNRGWIIIDYID